VAGIPGLLIALVLHELAHALVSTWLGDPTPGLQGRLSLNPLAHIDWIGMIMLWVFRFGWAKPVQIDPRYYRNPRVGLLLVAIAGPVMNVLVALVALVVWGHLPLSSTSIGSTVFFFIVIYNVYFAVFNILPIPPLDGSRVLSAVSREGARLMRAVEPWGWVVLILLIVTGIIDPVLSAMARGLLGALTRVAGAAPGL
jgi:Zn-dependent protease